MHDLCAGAAESDDSCLAMLGRVCARPVSLEGHQQEKFTLPSMRRVVCTCSQLRHVGIGCWFSDLWSLVDVASCMPGKVTDQLVGSNACVLVAIAAAH